MSRQIAKILATMFIGGAAAMGGAQTVNLERANSATQLDLPEQFTVFGERDPNIRKPTAIVNGEIITRTDVDHRLALMLAANQGLNIGEEERNRLQMQVLRNLIDETLQIQEAAANEIDVPATDIQSTFQRVAGDFAGNAEEFDEYLSQSGSSARSIQRQIEGELAWNRLLRRNVMSRVNVSQAEVQAVRDALEASRGQTEYRVAEIYLSARPDNEAQVRANADRIIDQVRQGGSFQAYAQQFSEASTAAVGGDLGWVRPEQLPAEISQLLPQMEVNSISRPIPLPGGFSIVALVDQRQILTADPRDAVLSLKQITIEFPAGTDQASASERVDALGSATQQGGGCGAADGIASSVGGNVVQNDDVRMGDLPPALQQAMTTLQIGQASPPFGSLEGGVRVLILCGRDDPPATAEPDMVQIEQRMEDERVNRQAQRYLRDLRRDAVIEYR